MRSVVVLALCAVTNFALDTCGDRTGSDGTLPMQAPVEPEATLKASYTMPPRQPTWAPIATIAFAGHGRPYSPEMIAERMASESTTLLPTPLRTESIATALADLVWSYDGRPYARLVIGGSCGDDGRTCSVTVYGIPAFAPDRDAADYYWFDVDVRTGVIGPGGHNLRGVPPGMTPALDQLARALLPDARLQDGFLLPLEWTLPPPPDAYALSYRFGDLEAAHITTVVIDADSRTIVRVEEWGAPRMT